MLYLVGVILTLLLIGTSEFVQAVKYCKRGWTCMGSSSYTTVNRAMTYDAAKKWCEGAGSSLATIEDAEEEIYLRRAIPLYATVHPVNYWLGGSDLESEGSWVWINGKPIRTTGTNGTYSNWYWGQPDDYKQNEDCLTLNYGWRLRWNDMPCDTKAFVLCELPYCCI